MVRARRNRTGTGETTVRTVLVCSNGGHLARLARFRSWWETTDRLWVTFRQADAESMLAGERVVWAYQPTQRNPVNAVRNTALAWRVLRRERPDVVFSSGAGVAPPFFVVAKLLGVKTVYVEAYERIDGPTLTGRLCYPMSDLFLVQGPEQQRFYPKSKLIGAVA